MQQPQASNRASDVTVIAVFLALLFLPAVLAVFGFARPDTEFLRDTEGRRQFVAPTVSSGALATGGYERDLERQIADAFPLRSQLIAMYGHVKFFWLGDSTTASTVRGRDGWVFYANEERRYATGAWQPTDADLEHIAAVYADRARWCAQRRIRYVLVFAPNKSTIYAAEAPPWYRPVPPTPLDRLYPMLAAQGVTTVDVRAQLFAAARQGEVYSRGDSHWNDAGAYVAYRAVLAALRPIGVRDAVHPTGTHVELHRGDVLGLNAVIGAIDHVVKFDYPRRAIEASLPPWTASAPQFKVHVTTVADRRLPVLVLFGDSFSNALAPYLAEDAQRLVHLQQGVIDESPQFDRSVVEAEHPAAVVQELVERNLYFGETFRP
jgi:alginate O-acetyltransferase complex protein AlgJ